MQEEITEIHLHCLYYKKFATDLLSTITAIFWLPPLLSQVFTLTFHLLACISLFL